MENFDHATHII